MQMRLRSHGQYSMSGAWPFEVTWATRWGSLSLFFMIQGRRFNQRKVVALGLPRKTRADPHRQQDRPLSSDGVLPQTIRFAALAAARRLPITY